MKIVLEAQDLLEILSLHLKRPLTPDQVVVRTDPGLEIEIEGAVAVADLGGAAPVIRADAAPYATSRTATHQETVEDDGMSMRDILAHSRQIEGDIRSLSRR